MRLLLAVACIIIVGLSIASEQPSVRLAQAGECTGQDCPPPPNRDCEKSEPTTS